MTVRAGKKSLKDSIAEQLPAVLADDIWDLNDGDLSEWPAFRPEADSTGLLTVVHGVAIIEVSEDALELYTDPLSLSSRLCFHATGPARTVEIHVISICFHLYFRVAMCQCHCGQAGLGRLQWYSHTATQERDRALEASTIRPAMVTIGDHGRTYR